MNTNLLSIVKQITGEYGEDVLGDARRLKALFSDLAQDEPKPLCTAFLKCVESGFYRNVKNTQSAEERRDVIERLAVRLRDDEGYDLTLCTEALEVLAVAVFGEGAAAPAPEPAPPPAPKKKKKLSIGMAFLCAVVFAVICALIGALIGFFQGDVAGSAAVMAAAGAVIGFFIGLF